MDNAHVREKSWVIAGKLGYPVNPALPLIESDLSLRSSEEIVGRMLAMNIVLARAYGFKRELALERLEQSNSSGYVTGSEFEFVQEGLGDVEEFKERVEALWALGYVASLIDDIDHVTNCSPNFVKSFPDLRSGNGTENFRSLCVVRPFDEVFQMLDLTYCLHWGIRDAQVRSQRLPGSLMPYVVGQRRLALEWCCSDKDWEEITLDT